MSSLLATTYPTLDFYISSTQAVNVFTLKSNALQGE